MQILRDINFFGPSKDLQQFVIGTAGRTFLASFCGYGGTFFFTKESPMLGAAYLGSVALVSQLAYYALDKLKDRLDKAKEGTDNSTAKHVITLIQLFQFPMAFYFLHAGSQFLSAAVKLEILAATAYFIAIPIFFYLGVAAWNEPSLTNIAAAVGVMLPLASGMRGYAAQFP